MRPLFTPHAGEYLVGSHLEQHFPELRVWLPSRDSGIDLLVTDRVAKRATTLQVKFSKDFLVTHVDPAFRVKLRACGWWKFNRDKLRASTADYWVLVLQGFGARSTDFVVIRPANLLARLEFVHGKRGSTIQCYVWVSQANTCWETRGLQKAEQIAVAEGSYTHSQRGLTKYLNNWTPITRIRGPRAAWPRRSAI